MTFSLIALGSVACQTRCRFGVGLRGGRQILCLGADIVQRFSWRSGRFRLLNSDENHRQRQLVLKIRIVLRELQIATCTCFDCERF